MIIHPGGKNRTAKELVQIIGICETFATRISLMREPARVENLHVILGRLQGLRSVTNQLLNIRGPRSFWQDEFIILGNPLRVKKI